MLQFHPHLIETVIGGQSAIDLPRLEIPDLESAYEFAHAYGYDLNDSQDLEEVWSLHRRAIALIRGELLNDGETIPAALTDPTLLQDIAYLLVFASSKASDPKSKELQGWACGILRVIHTLAHVENDVFSHYGDQIQEQMLRPFREHMIQDSIGGTLLGLSTDIDQIPLHRFDVKPFKARTSAVIKLLSKPQAVAFHLLDKMGVRFVTKNIFDAFRVVRLLHRENIISFPNVMPDQSRNTLYPMNLLLEVLKEVPKDISGEKLHSRMMEKLNEPSSRAEYLAKPNEFSSGDYKELKFIARKLIEVGIGEKRFHFFFPLEVQIVDYDNFIRVLSGPGSHEEYKKRQRDAARRRVLGHIADLKSGR